MFRDLSPARVRALIVRLGTTDHAPDHHRGNDDRGVDNHDRNPQSARERRRRYGAVPVRAWAAASRQQAPAIARRAKGAADSLVRVDLITRAMIGGSIMESTYRDRWIECTPGGISIRGYYFPWGTKHIAYRSIRSLKRVELTALRGKGRIWGTANPRYWASLDPQRPNKSVGLILDLGRYVRPFITPDDPDAVEAIIRERADLESETAGPEDSPIL
jgi:hypothetical protein